MLRMILAVCSSALAVELYAQPIALSGKVTDAAGKAIGGAVIRLKSKQMSDTTDASGMYALNGTPASLLRPEGLQGARLREERFDAQGSRLQGHPTSAGISFALLSSGEPSERSRLPLAKPTALEDTLEAAALGYKTKAIPISAYEGKHDITLTSEFTGTCTESRPANTTVRGSGPHSVVVETNSDDGIKEGTIFRPADLGPGKKYPILVWGEGACARNGLDNAASMAEIASHGYFIIADGTPNGTGSRPMNANNLEEMGRAPLAYITWAIAENRKPCSRYYQSLDTSRIDANGFSCGGLLAMGTAKDPRITTWGLTSSGSFNDNPTLWKSVHTPVLIIQGHKDATGAYTNGLRDYNGIAPLGHPILFLSHRNLGHGGDLWSANGGDFTRIHLAWINWWLKGDLGAKGKGALVGAGCTYCTNSNWEVKSANLP